MKSIFIKIKNLIPYLFLIVVYFFFVNLEARNNKLKKRNQFNTNNSIELNNIKSDAENSNLIIKIPVYPYNK